MPRFTSIAAQIGDVTKTCWSYPKSAWILKSRSMRSQFAVYFLGRAQLPLVVAVIAVTNVVGACPRITRDAKDVPLMRATYLMGLTAVMAAATAVAGLLALRRGEAECTGVCGPVVVTLPAAAAFGAVDPAVTIGLFVDLESAASRQVFQQVTRSLQWLALETPTEMRLLHLPGTGCDAGTAAPGCVGARAVECAERLAGAGVLAAGAVFDLQWIAASQRTPARVLAAVAGVGVEATALADCVEEDATVDQRLAAHAAVAARHGLAAAPGGLVFLTEAPERSAGFGVWLTERTLGDIVRCLAHGRCEAAS